MATASSLWVGSARVPAVAAAGTVGCGQWPMYAHDPSHTGAATGCPGTSAISASDVSRLRVHWFTATGDVTATPAVVDGRVYAGDAQGTFWALDQATGDVDWTFSVAGNAVHDDRHQTGFGEFVSSPTVVILPGRHHPTVFVGGGGSLYAIDAVTGRPLWAQDLDPDQPQSAIEAESSPAVDLATSPPEVLIGSDDNGSPGIDVTGLQAFDASTGRLLWKYEPERDRVVHSLSGDDGKGDACGDVWSSPAIDSRAGLVLFGTGNCADNVDAAKHGDFARNAGVFALQVTTGRRRWSFFEPPNQYDTGKPADVGNGDDDFGSSPVLTSIGTRPVVIEASKSGYVYALDERTGAQVWQDEPAQAGQLSPQLVGAVGGVIGSPALGVVRGQPALFLSSAVPLPFTGEGVDLSGSSVPPAQPDTTLLAHPGRMVSLHAVSVRTGALLWQAAVSTPTYASVSYSAGLVLLPATTGLSVIGYDADRGTPLWSVPTGAAAPAGGVAIAGADAFFGTGISEGSAAGTALPPETSGIYGLALSG
jgi:polyvinyl alcohol dehydrogenase (cytochrome)